MNELYETKISNARWWAYDIPGNIGWIIWLICLGMCLKAGPDLFALLAMIPAVLMVIGVGELVSERIAKLDRVLPKLRVWRGFGALALGGILGIAVAIVGLVYITGDTRGEFSRIEQFCEPIKPTRDDTMIILGDVGINYYGE